MVPSRQCMVTASWQGSSSWSSPWTTQIPEVWLKLTVHANSKTPRMAPWCSAPMPAPALRLRLCPASLGAVGPRRAFGEWVVALVFASGLEDAFQQISPPPVSPPVKGDALHHQALDEALAAGSTGNTHSTTLPTPALITSYLENALIDLSFLLFSTVPIFALLVSVQASPCVPNHLKLYCCLHLHPHLLLFHQLLHA